MRTQARRVCALVLAGAMSALFGASARAGETPVAIMGAALVGNQHYLVMAQEMPPVIGPIGVAVISQGKKRTYIKLGCIDYVPGHLNGVGTSPSFTAYLSGHGSDGSPYYIRLAASSLQSAAGVSSTSTGGPCGAGGVKTTSARAGTFISDYHKPFCHKLLPSCI